MKKLFIALAIWIAIIMGVMTYEFINYDQPIAEVQPVIEKPILLPTDTQIESGVNSYRTSKGIAALGDSYALDVAAQARAEGMCADNNWSHTKDKEVLDQYYIYSTAGENLYFGTLRRDQAVNAITDWVKSPTHLANIVGNYIEIGTGIKLCPNYQGLANVVIITNYFGVPR